MSASEAILSAPAVAENATEQATYGKPLPMERARRAQASWQETPIRSRISLVGKLRQLIAREASNLAQASVLFRSRPPLESITSEVFPLIAACRFLEHEAETILATRKLGRSGLPLWLTGLHSEIHREPHGVVLIIGPGNYPLMLPGIQVIQALVAGNAVILKPGQGGERVAVLLRKLMITAGFDPHLFTILNESKEAAQAAISARPDKVIFTGSARTGQVISGQLAEVLIPSTMELSGNDPVIIRRDADLELAARAISFGLALNGGATCMAPRRVFVQPEFEGRLEQLLRDLHNRPLIRTKTLAPSGDEPQGSQNGQFSGNSNEPKMLTALVLDALSSGARIVAGGLGNVGGLLAPTILAGVPAGSRLLQEDFFFPLLSIVTVKDDEEAVERANDSPFGLAASIFSRDEAAARAVAARLRSGIVTINDVILPSADPRVPLGGRGQSGFGTTRGAEGLLELTTQKVVCLTTTRFRPAYDPSQPEDLPLFLSYLRLTNSSGIRDSIKAITCMIQAISKRRSTQSGNCT